MGWALGNMELFWDELMRVLGSIRAGIDAAVAWMNRGRIDGVAGKIQVRRSVGKKDQGPEVVTQDLIPATVFDAPHATVSCGMGITVNLGSYESARVDVHISIPCYPAEVEEAYQHVRGLCENRIREEVKNVKGGK